MSTKKMNIDLKEALRRIESLDNVFWLAHDYSRVKRATLASDGQQETDGEHAISLAMIATAYALKYHPDLDPYKVFFYGVMHDIDEFLYGDTPTLHATKQTFKRKQVEEAEARVRRTQILHEFPELNDMIDDLSNLSLRENAFSKAFDKLAPGYTHAKNKGKALKEVYNIHSYNDILDATELTDQKMRVYAAEFTDVIKMRAEMHKKVAREAFEGK